MRQTAVIQIILNMNTDTSWGLHLSSGIPSDCVSSRNVVCLQSRVPLDCGWLGKCYEAAERKEGPSTLSRALSLLQVGGAPKSGVRGMGKPGWVCGTGKPRGERGWTHSSASLSPTTQASQGQNQGRIESFCFVRRADHGAFVREVSQPLWPEKL